MNIEEIYMAYLQREGCRKHPDLEIAADAIMKDISDLAPGQIEERIHEILDLQEKVAFEAGFLEAVDTYFSLVHRRRGAE